MRWILAFLICHTALADPGLTAAQKKRASSLIAVFENEQINPRYEYAENLRDGRGITSGWVGFCTGCGDATEVLSAYARRRPGNALSQHFLATVADLGRRNSADVSHLNGYTAEWRKAAADSEFRAAQEDVSDRLYYRPAMRHAANLGLRHDLSLVALFEAIVQHGNGDDPDGLPALIKGATRQARGTPAQGVDEKAWLACFFDHRKNALLHAYDPHTREAWRQSVGRADAMIHLLSNIDFRGPIEVTPFGKKFTIR